MRREIDVLVFDHQSNHYKAVAKIMKLENRIRSIDCTQNGYEVISKVITNRPDVVLLNMDTEMGMAGIFVCKEINASAPDVKVIFCGNNCSSEIVFNAFQMGGVNFLNGGYDERDLLNAVLDAADGKSVIHHSTAHLLRGEFKRIMDLQENYKYVINILIKLTRAEIVILKHFYDGRKSKEITKILFISQTTMKTHVTHILKKFKLESMANVVSVLRSTELFSLLNPQIYEV